MPQKLYDLRLELAKPFLFGEGHDQWSFSGESFKFLEEIKNHIASQTGITIAGPLEGIHRELPMDFQTLNTDGLNALTKPISQISRELVKVYCSMVARMAKDHLKSDVVFESDPFLRFHFPIAAPSTYRGFDGRLLAYHSDTLFGDYFEQINCWMAFSNCDASNTMQIAPMTESLKILTNFSESLDFDWDRYASGRRYFFEKLRDDNDFSQLVTSACYPLMATYGTVHLFDPRFVHGTSENKENTTRISLDFRVIKVSDYERITAKADQIDINIPGFNNKAYTKGDYFHENSAYNFI